MPEVAENQTTFTIYRADALYNHEVDKKVVFKLVEDEQAIGVVIFSDFSSKVPEITYHSFCETPVKFGKTDAFLKNIEQTLIGRGALGMITFTTNTEEALFAEDHGFESAYMFDETTRVYVKKFQL